MARKDVSIGTASASVAFVTPGRVPAGLNDTMKWTNNTSGRARLFFPHDDVLGAAKKHFVETIDPGRSYESQPAAKRGSYRYAIFCEETGTFAVGSDPEIIVN